MERASQDAIGGVESFFDAVAVVTVYIDVENSREGTEKFEDAEDYVVDVAETGCFAFFGVVEASGPVYGYV